MVATIVIATIVDNGYSISRGAALPLGDGISWVNVRW